MIITEHRWKCDYCGVVSPVIERGEEPHGWTIIKEFEISIYCFPQRNFCCKAHQTLWEDQQEDIIIA